MKKISLILLCLLLGCFTISSISVSGVIEYENERLYNALVQLNASSKLTCLTNENGYFTLDNINRRGVHELVINYNLDSNSFIGIDTSIQIDAGQNDLGLITLLPPGKILFIEDTGENTSTLNIKWKKIHDPAFKKYSLLKYGNDFEKEVIYESVDKNDTSFMDMMPLWGETNNYQLDVYYNWGRISRSKVKDTFVKKQTIVLNGDFEEETQGDSIPRWNRPSFFHDYFNLDDYVAYAGIYSLEAKTNPNAMMYDYRVTQEINKNILIAGRTYRFSLQMRTAANTTLKAKIYLYRPYSEVTPVLSLSPSKGWEEKSAEFVMPNTSTPMFVELMIYAAEGRDGQGWFDDVKLELLDY